MNGKIKQQTQERLRPYTRQLGLRLSASEACSGYAANPVDLYLFVCLPGAVVVAAVPPGAAGGPAGWQVRRHCKP